MDEHNRGQSPYYNSDERRGGSDRTPFDPSQRGIYDREGERTLSRDPTREPRGMARNLRDDYDGSPYHGGRTTDPRSQMRPREPQRYDYRDWERDHERRVNDRASSLQGNYGETGSGFGFDRDAVDRSERSENMRASHSVHHEKPPFRGPKNYKRSDDRIHEDVHERLTRQREFDPSEIEVAVKDGEVTLTGSVKQRREKLRAEELCDAVYGVVDIDNRLGVARAEQHESGAATVTSAVNQSDSALKT